MVLFWVWISYIVVIYRSGDGSPTHEDHLDFDDYEFEDEIAGDYDYGGSNSNTCPETCTGKENEQANNTSKSTNFTNKMNCWDIKM